ncbi:MAG: class I SAM-dependent methyltransferase [Aliarcobacter sp.]|jgi:ubiquinone/menaquinone biosynthesis C-methylase UbiE
MTKGREPENSSWYDTFYADGGWARNIQAEVQRLKSLLFDKIDLALGRHVIDIGCGMGVQAEAIRQLGYKVTGVDFSKSGIAAAKRDFPEVEFILKDAADLGYPDDHFDMAFLHGMSWYHYELDDVCLQRSKELVRMVKPGGYIALLIRTDFTGNRHFSSGIHLNKLSAYTNLFSRLGKIVLCTDWNGTPLVDDEQAVGKRSIVIVAQK